jgi:hypothetical protein
MSIDKNNLAKMLAISAAIKGDSKKETKKSEKDEITLPKLIVTFTIFFYLLNLIVNR